MTWIAPISVTTKVMFSDATDEKRLVATGAVFAAGFFLAQQGNVNRHEKIHGCPPDVGGIRNSLERSSRVVT